MNFGDIAVGPNGEVAIVYQNNDGDEGPDSIFSHFEPDGLANGITLSARKFVTATNVGDFDFIAPQPNRSVDSEANLAWDRSGGQHTGRLYLVYTDESPDEFDDLDVYVRFSDDLGRNWSTRRRVNNDGTTNSQFMPKVAVDQHTGFVAVNWYDARNDPGMGAHDTDLLVNTDVEEFIAFSFDGGNCFATNLQVIGSPSNAVFGGDGLNDFGDYQGLAFDAGIVYPAWIDNSVALTSPGLFEFDVAVAAIAVPTLNEEDRFEFNETSDQATNFGKLVEDHNLTDLSITTHQSGLPDYDWYRYQVGEDGRVTVTMSGGAADGALEVFLYTLDATNTLILLADSRSQPFACNQTYVLTANVTKNQALLIEVKGVNVVPGVHVRGNYNLNVRLTI
jgi:hypothetical protein